jgi:RHS repeat-associated protein
MLMPGRGGALGTNGLWQNSGNTSGLPANPTYSTPRENNLPLEYKATESITFLPGFESGEGDAFEAYITQDGGGTGSGGSGADLYAGGGYRYGFNGKENDNEVKGEGAQQDYGFRIYDPRLGRFLSMDPMSKSYPYLTPYQFASNSTVGGIDLDGLEFFKKDNTQYTIDYRPLVNAPGVLSKADNVAHNAMAFIWNNTIGAVAEGGKSVNNYFAGGYKEPTNNVVASFNQFQTEAAKYHTTTPIGQQLKDFGNVATDLRNYELPVQLLITHKLSAATPPLFASSELSSSKIAFERFKGGGTYASFEGRNLGWYQYSRAKGLELDLNIPSELQGRGLGSQIFEDAIKSTKANKFTATWIESLDYKNGSSINLQRYRNALITMSPEAAAWETWSGGQAKKFGFKNVSVRELKNGVEATFTK